MSYLVLARKYRPMFFEDVVGQQHVTRTLQNAIQQKRIANAYLFSGPRGVGKTTVARILAKALNCEQGPSITPCNKCSSCTEINESRSLDVFEIDGASNRGIDEVRNLRESLRYSPNPGKHRIYIIDEVHMLTNEAFNALLKTLEEPPKNVLFVFATTESHKVPATILSRCQRFDFKRITNQKIIEQLKQLCASEGIEIEEEALHHITIKGDGSMRDSESILDQIIAYAGKKITAKDVENLLGIINLEMFFRVTDLISKGDVSGGVTLASEIFIEGYDFNEFLLGLADHFRNILVCKSTQSTDNLDVTEEYTAKYNAIRDVFSVEDLLRLIKISSDTEYLIRRSSNARLHFEMALIKMINMNKSTSLAQLLEQFAEVKKKADTVTKPKTTPVTPSAETDYTQSKAPRFLQKVMEPAADVQPENRLEDSAPASATASGKAADLSIIESKWNEIVERIKKQKIAVGTCLSESWPTALSGKILEISFDPHCSFQQSNVERNKDIVQNIIADTLGDSYKIRCVKDEKGILKETRKVVPVMDKKKQFEQLLNENNIVKNIVDTFNTELMD